MTGETTETILTREQAARVECAKHAAEMLRARTGAAGLGSMGGKLSSWEIIDLATWLCTGEKAVYPEDAEEQPETAEEPEPVDGGKHAAPIPPEMEVHRTYGVGVVVTAPEGVLS